MWYISTKLPADGQITGLLIVLVSMSNVDSLLDLARQKLSDKPYDPAHDLAHHLEVMRNGLKIAHNLEETEKLDFDVLRIAAMWHDVPMENGAVKDATATAEFIKEKMQELGFHQDSIDKVYSAISLHSFDSSPDTIEGKVLYDADKLELINPQRFIRYAKAVEAGKAPAEKAKEDFAWAIKAISNVRARLNFESSRTQFDKQINELRQNNSAKAAFQKFGQNL